MDLSAGGCGAAGTGQCWDLPVSRLDEVAELGCVLCAHFGCPGTPAEIHHLRDGQGLSQRASDEEVIPLCPEHHRGRAGYHGLGKRAFEHRYRVTERELLALTRELLGR